MRTRDEILAGELKEIAALAADAIDDVIGSRSGDNFSLECFESALRALRSIRMMLESEAEKLDPKQAVAS